MKKLLIASTALVATASVAAADVTFGGYGRFGLIYQENDGTTGVDETRLENRFRLDIRGTTESDGGVEFTARVRIESNDTGDGQVGASNVEAPEFGVSAGGFSLFVGDTSDVLDSGDIVDFYGDAASLTAAFAELSSGFSFDNFPASGFGNPGPRDPVVKADYRVGAFTIAASYQHNARDDAREEYMIGARYDISDAIGVGLVYGDQNDGATIDSDFWALGVDGSFGAFGYDVLIADSSAASQDDVAMALGLNYAVSSATSIRFVVSDNGLADTATVNQTTAYAIGFRHSLGGGVQLGGGVGVDSSDNTVADLGVQFNF
ncbi:MAG: porin [Woeseiaceae bacterium]|jgi:outer membrane protein OmpU|nr:porin [Woeseiaceae bacterium]